MANSTLNVLIINEREGFMRKYLLASTVALLPLSAHAASVDLSSWIENGYPNNSAGTWVVQPGNDSVKQTINGAPTVFFESGSNAQGTALRGTISVANDGDDDFVGFVLGYQNGEITSSSADFWLIDWKQGNQSGQTAGLALSHVSGDLTGTTTGVSGEWWQHDAPVNEVLRATNLATTGYLDNQSYTFDLIFSDSLIQVKVDGVVELNYTSADNGGALFMNGAFGFYNFSQSQVTYAGLVEDTNPGELNGEVPLPASLPFLLSAFGLTALLRRRKA